MFADIFTDGRMEKVIAKEVSLRLTRATRSNNEAKTATDGESYLFYFSVISIYFTLKEDFTPNFQNIYPIIVHMYILNQ